MDRLIKKANFIDVYAGEPAILIFAHHRTTQYSYEWGYKIYSMPLSTDEQENIDDGCRNIVYNERMVLYYNPMSQHPPMPCMNSY